MTKQSLLESGLSWIENQLVIFGMLCVWAIVFILLGQVFLRYAFSVSLVWAEEIARFCSIIIVFTCAAYFMRVNENVSVKFLFDKLGAKRRRWAYVLLQVGQIAVAIMFVLGCIHLIAEIGHTRTTGARMSLTLFITPAFLGFTLVVLEGFRQIYLALVKNEVPQPDAFRGVVQ